jgi:zinc protease
VLIPAAFVFVVALALPSPALATDATVGSSRAIVLDNGVEVVISPRGGVPLATVVAVVHSGSSSESASTGGAAHMLEHLLFNGTGKRTQETLYSDLDSRGIIHNAHTGEGETTLFMLGPVDQLGAILEIETDMLFHSTFPAEKLEKERGIVLNEIARDQTQDDSHLQAFTAEVLFTGTPCARPVIGTQESIQSLTREAILDFHRRHYVPSNVTLIVMGDVDAGQAFASIRSTFGAVATANAPPALVATARATPEPAAGGGQGPSTGGSSCSLSPGAAGRAHSRRAEIGSRYVTLAAGAPGLDEPLHPAATILASLLEPDLASATNRRLKEGGVLSASVSLDPRCSESILLATAALGPGLSYEEAARALREEMAARLAAPIDSASLDARKLAERVRISLLEDRPHYYGLDRAPIVACRGWSGVADAARRLESTSPAEVARLAAGYLDPGAWASIFVGKDAPGIPEARTEDREGHATTGPGTSSAGVAGPEEIREVLDNGLVLRIRSGPGSPVFAACVIARDRSAREPRGKEGIADLLHRLAGTSTRDRDASSLGDALTGIGAAVKVTDDPQIPYDDADTSSEFSFIRLETLDEFGPTALEILAEMVREPGLDQASIDRLRGAQLERARQAAGRPADRAKALMLKNLYGEPSPLARSPFGTEASLRSIAPSDLESFRSVYFAPGNLILSIVTSLPAGRVRDAVAASFGKIPSGDVTRARPERPPTASARKAAAPVRQSAGSRQAYVLMAAALRPRADEVTPLAAAAAVLTRRMSFELREKRGLSYSLGAGVEPVGQDMLFTIRMGTTPPQMEDALKGIDEMLEGLRSSPPTPEEIATAVRTEGVRQMMRALARTNQAFSAGLLELRSASKDAAGSKIPAPWTDLSVPEPREVSRVVSRYLQADRLSRVILD